MPIVMNKIELVAESARVALDPADGGRIERLTVGELPLLVPPEANERDYGAFPMAPWAGRLRDGRFSFDGVDHQMPRNKPPHAIHGTVRDQRWNVDRDDGRSAVLSTSLVEPWPFEGRVVQRFDLMPESLALTMEIHTARRAMPASCGWHPWWSRDLGRGEPLEIELRADGMYQRDGSDIPTGELTRIDPPPWDDCFTDLGTPAAVLHWPGAASVSIETDCPCVVVFTEPEHAECVEPQSGPPDALNLAPQVVTPDAPLVVHTTWRWKLG